MEKRVGVYFKEIGLFPKIRVLPSGTLSQTLDLEIGHDMLTIGECNINKHLAGMADVASAVNSG